MAQLGGLKTSGAESLVKALVDNGIRACFANPGTSEMHLVTALDRNSAIRSVLGLFEGVCTGAADGYARMLDAPATTLLHLGPGLANGLSNLHNAMRANSPVVNIVGDHATTHRSLDAPLTSDIEGTARPFSHWIRTSQSVATLGSDTVAAVAAARSAPGRVATLIVPADAAWSTETHLPGPALMANGLVTAPARPPDSKIEAGAKAIAEPGPVALLLNGQALRPQNLELAGRIAAATGARLLHPTHAPRVARGAGRVNIDRISYGVSQAMSELGDLRTIILVGAKAPVAFFAYPNLPGRLYPPAARILELAGSGEDLRYALEALAERVVGKRQTAVRLELALPEQPTGEITSSKLGALIESIIPEN